MRKLLDSSWFYFSLAALLLVVAVLSQFEFQSLGRPSGDVQDLRTLRDRERLNVVFIVIDMLRSDRLSAYGYERETSPVMDELASHGILFRNVESQSSWTKASMASMWTGMYPQRTGVHRYPHAVPEEALLPAEIFREAGYTTAGVWRNGWVANNFGFAQGFDLYIRPRVNAKPDNVKRNNPSAHALVGTDLDATESAIEFIRSNAADPFFLYVHYMDVHQYLYADVSPDFGSSFSDIYDSSIYWTDRNVQYLMSELMAQGLLDDTLVVIGSDHGEAFFEHGEEGHARSLYRETQQVPLIIIPPFSLDPGVVVDTRVANVDIWPTILDLVGLQELPGAEGQSLVPLITAAAAGEEPESDRAVYSQLDRTWGRHYGEEVSNRAVAMVKGPYRLVYYEKQPNRPELYDHAEDPTERMNVAHENVDLTKDLIAQVNKFLEGQNTVWEETPEVEIDEMRLHQLRALGYFVDGGPKKGMRNLEEVLEDERQAREGKKRFDQDRVEDAATATAPATGAGADGEGDGGE